MRFSPTELPEVLRVEFDAIADERGTFTNLYDERAFAKAGAPFEPNQLSRSVNHRAGTLRGLHFQIAPGSQAKLVRCVRGSAFDVAVDVRPGSPSLGRWTSLEISAANDLAFFLPAGFAHGFQTLETDTWIEYLIEGTYAPELERGVRWDDPDIAVAWPEAVDRTISGRDLALPTLAEMIG